MKKSLGIILFCFMVAFYLSACRNNSKNEVSLSGNNSVMSEVDLGLSVQWANMNLGADKPEAFGKFYALGDVQPYDSIPPSIDLPDDWQEWHDSMGVVLPKYDAASYQTGNKWRIPTIEEWSELAEKCKWRWVNYNGVEGYYIEGPNGNSIFLPAAGNTESKYGDELNGYYRCSYVWDGGATFSVYFLKPKEMPIPKINLNIDFPEGGDVWLDTYGCQVPASVRPVKVK